MDSSIRLKFNNSKYTRLYFSIIDRAAAEDRQKFQGVYYERHHVVPRSLGGKAMPTVLLTAREHFICHALLLNMLNDAVDQHRMATAFLCMVWRKAPNQKRITSRLYQALRNKACGSMNAHLRGKKRPAEVRKKISRSHTGIKHTEERRKNISLNHHDVSGQNNPRFGVEMSAETKAKIGAQNAGRPSPFKGKRRDQSVIDKIREKSRAMWGDPETKLAFIEKARRTRALTTSTAR